MVAKDMCQAPGFSEVALNGSVSQTTYMSRGHSQNSVKMQLNSNSRLPNTDARIKKMQGVLATVCCGFSAALPPLWVCGGVLGICLGVHGCVAILLMVVLWR